MKYLFTLALFVAPVVGLCQQVFYQTFTPASIYNAYGAAGGRSTASHDLDAEAWTFNLPEGPTYVAKWSATRFVPSETFTLTSITIPLVTASRFDQADVNVRMGFLWFGIYSNDGNAPGSPLFRLSNPSVGQIASYSDGTLAGSEFTAPSSFVFNASQTYWIVLGPDLSAVGTEDGSTAWAWRAFRPPSSNGLGSVTSTAVNPGPGDWATFASTGTFNVAFDAPPPDGTVYTDWEGAMSISGLSAVPEPSTYAAILGLVAIGATAFVRRKNATPP